MGQRSIIAHSHKKCVQINRRSERKPKRHLKSENNEQRRREMLDSNNYKKF